MKLNFITLALVCLVAIGFNATAPAGEVTALAAQRDLTPEAFIRSFAGFAFELSAQPQDPEAFLQRRRGDCDDFASLASRLFTDRGYKTKLVVVMMERQTHVVCYVKEAHGFLDFNHRSDSHPIVESDGSLEDIAQKVAGDFHGRWHMASEFRYENKSPVYLDVVFPPAAPANNLIAAVVPAPAPKRQGTNDFVSSLPVSSAPMGFDKAAAAEPSGPSARASR